MIDPCAPLMSNAAWIRFLIGHPGWRAPLHSLGPCVKVGATLLPLLAVGPAAPVAPSPSYGGFGPNARDIAPYSTPTQPGYGSALNTAAVGTHGPFPAVPPSQPPAVVWGGQAALAPQTGVCCTPLLAGGGSPPLSFEHQPPRAPGPSLPDVGVAPDVTPVPEPSALACMIGALVAVGLLRRRA